MTYVILSLWIISAVIIVLEQKIIRSIIHLGIFALITSVCFLLLGAPDVAMAQAVVGVFSTIFYIVSLGKHFDLTDPPEAVARASLVKRYILLACFVAVLLGLFIWFMPPNNVNTYLKNQFITMFKNDVGGENAVTAVYLGYRMYDTLFEALMLLVSIVAVTHLSWHKDVAVSHGKPSGIHDCDIADVTIRLICPVLILFSIYLVLNGHISPGGGFQGGMVLASFFVCRYMIHDIYDLKINRVVTLEKLVFTGILLMSVLFILLGLGALLSIPKTVYLITINLLICIKITCGFLVIFYRYIAFERR